jgi:hypothetical protein
MGGLAFTALTAASPSVEVDGLVISAEPDALGESFGVSVVARPPADYLAENTPDAGWFCETSLPPGHALASNVYSLAQTGITPDRLAIQVAALADAAGDPAALELNVWNAADSQWQFVAGGADETGRVGVDLAYLPRCVAVFRESGRCGGPGCSASWTSSRRSRGGGCRLYRRLPTWAARCRRARASQTNGATKYCPAKFR